MGLQCGIVGLPNVGKSTLFNALTNAKAQAANFPFCTIEPNIGVITFPDDRLNTLGRLVKPEKVLPTTIEIVDIAGLVQGASKGEGLGNQFLANIRSVDAIIHVVRCFKDDNITHVHDIIDPVRDKEIVDTELQLKDLDTLQKRIDKSQKHAKTGDKKSMQELEMLKDLFEFISSGQSARNYDLNDDLKSLVSDLHLLTIKPVLYVCNVDEKNAASGNEYTESFIQTVEKENGFYLIISAAIESEISEFDSYEERQIFLEDIGLNASGLNKLIKSSYALLNLITFFTAGKQEVRAWTIRKETKAPASAGVIHTDFERGFIKAEVISYNDFENLGSEQICKEKGKMRLEGKEYVVSDGDIMHFKFNV